MIGPFRIYSIVEVESVIFRPVNIIQVLDKIFYRTLNWKTRLDKTSLSEILEVSINFLPKLNGFSLSHCMK